MASLDGVTRVPRWKTSKRARQRQQEQEEKKNALHAVCYSFVIETADDEDSKAIMKKGGSEQPGKMRKRTRREESHSTMRCVVHL